MCDEVGGTGDAHPGKHQVRPVHKCGAQQEAKTDGQERPLTLRPVGLHPRRHIQRGLQQSQSVTSSSLPALHLQRNPGEADVHDLVLVAGGEEEGGGGHGRGERPGEAGAQQQLGI